MVVWRGALLLRGEERSLGHSVYGCSPSHPTVRHLCLLGQGLRLQTPLLKLMQMGLRPLWVGPVCAAEAGPGKYKGHAAEVWEASIQILQNAEGLLCPEKARFHRVGSISDHFVRRLLVAKHNVVALPCVARVFLLC